MEFRNIVHIYTICVSFFPFLIAHSHNGSPVLQQILERGRGRDRESESVEGTGRERIYVYKLQHTPSLPFLPT